MSRLIATWFYSGYLKPAPGTWGSLAALPFAYVLHLLGGPWLLLLATLAIFALGYWATGRETAGKADHDPSEIVVDEVVGQWLALWPVSYGAVFAGADVLRLWPGILAAFLFFRLFDIWKPGPARAAERNLPGGLGVMMDDVVAGLFSAVVVGAAALLYAGAGA